MSLTDPEQHLIEIIKGLVSANSHLVRLCTEFRNHTDAAIVLSTTEILKEQIGKAICTQFDPLKSRDIKQILGKPASPKGLAVQIDVARALGIFDDATYEIAIRILNLRNVFGHDKRMLSLSQEPASTAFRAFHTNPKFTGSYASVFLKYAGVVEARLDSYLAPRQQPPARDSEDELEAG